MLFSTLSDTHHSEPSIDNNVSARLAAHIAGFTSHQHSIVCTTCADSQQHTRSPLHLDETGLFLMLFRVFVLFGDLLYVEENSAVVYQVNDN